MIAEIWVGGLEVPAHKLENIKRVETSMDGCYCKITTENGYTYETSPHNVVLITAPNEKDPKRERR